MPSTPTAVLVAYPQRYFDAWNQRDLATALEVVHEKIYWTDPLAPEPMTDHEAVSGFFGGAWSGFPDIHFVAIGDPLVDEAGGRVACSWRMTGTHTGEFPPGVAPSGNTFDVVGTDVWEVDADGRATTVAAFYDSLTLLRAIGLA